MKKIKIACDVDDVLSAFYPAMCKKFNKVEKQVNIWDGADGGDCAWVAAKFPKLYNSLEFWKTIPKISNPESITFNIDYYITSLPNFLHNIRKQWLISNGFPIRPLICTLTNKVDTMKALGVGVLIDDRPSTIKNVREAGLIGIQFVPPYMNDYDKNDPFTIKHLSEVNKILGI